MSRPWIAFYMGDYLKKTKDLTLEQHGAYLLLLIECWVKGALPEGEAKRARILGVSPLHYRRKIAPFIEHFFHFDGTNKRATEEIEKAEKFFSKRAIAGRKGGLMSGLSRSSKRSKREANNEANAKQKTKPSSTNHNHKNLTTTTSVAAREEPNPAVGPATALPTGAPSRPPPTTNGEAKRPPRKQAKKVLDLAEGTVVGPDVLAKVWADK